jgi:hypothetical protein
MPPCNDFHGLLHVTGHESFTNTRMTNARTIQATAAFERCNSC